MEKVVADAERAVAEALEKQFSEFLSPLKESKISPLKYVQRLTKKGTSNLYSVPKEVCLLLFLIFMFSELFVREYFKTCFSLEFF